MVSGMYRAAGQPHDERMQAAHGCPHSRRVLKLLLGATDCWGPLTGCVALPHLLKISILSCHCPCTSQLLRFALPEGRKQDKYMSHLTQAVVQVGRLSVHLPWGAFPP